MHILITGGTGFLGRKLAAALLEEGVMALDGEAPAPIQRITLFDAFEGADLPRDPKLRVVTGDIASPDDVEPLAHDADLVWHLAAIVSADAEADFDRGMRINLDGTRTLLEALRATGRRPRLVFASSLAVYGGAMPDPIVDGIELTPQTSYGTQKAMGELLVADYSRKGFVDGRALRLPTIMVRPGKPNKAASTFVSSIVREPLAGQEAICPVSRETSMFVLSPRRCVAALMHAMRLPDAAFGTTRSVQLPGITVAVDEVVEALRRIAGDGVAGRIRFLPDDTIARIVAGWAFRADAARGRSLGFAADAGVDELIHAHIEDELEGRFVA